MFDTVLVANRGEIAARIMRTLRSLSIRSVAVYSDADADALHVRVADVALRIGPTPAVESYLSVERIIEAVLASGAQALHPGYGFLSENAALAEACAAAGIVFIGPPVPAILAMGDKIRAKATVAANGVPVVPGVSGAGLDDDALVERARQLDLPLLIKPSAGGGGKGMRLVTARGELAEAIAASRREALAAFGDDTLLVERFIERPRHIEVQILADAHGNVVHLGERECSLQRRHQKVIEEAPSPLLADVDRAAIGAEAVRAAQACGYVSAGTVEFIVSANRPDEPYFMEMNTRLQVEHPVTEMVWGIDLVEQQLRIAAGERLAVTQADLAPRGHAFEARVYAEDPTNQFLPTGGTVLDLVEPQGPHVRVDSSLTLGTHVGSHYDPMLSKVIAWGTDRDEARRRLRQALASTTVLGVTTNLGFLRRVLDHPDVVTGTLDTGLLERIIRDAPVDSVSPVAAVAAALADVATGAGRSAWDDRRGWRIGPRSPLRWTGAIDDVAIGVELRPLDDADAWEATVCEQRMRVVRAPAPHGMRLAVDGHSTAWRVAHDVDVSWLGHDGDTWRSVRRAPRPANASGVETGDASLVSPMPGRVVALLAAVGDQVVVDQPIVIVEAMKMEYAVRSSIEGVVTDVSVEPGDAVALRQPLATVTAPAHLASVEEPT